MKACVEQSSSHMCPKNQIRLSPLFFWTWTVVIWWHWLSPSWNDWEWKFCTSWTAAWACANPLMLASTSHSSSKSKVVGGLNGQLQLEWHSHCPSHSILQSEWCKHTIYQSRNYATHGWKRGMIGLPALRWKTEMVECTLVLMMLFCDNAEVNSNVDWNLAWAGILQNKE